MKTPMQIMLGYILEIERHEVNEDFEYIKENCIKLIDSEKQDIMFAYEAGQEGTFSESVNYYNETYKSEP
jgi:hypothetical protein